MVASALLVAEGALYDAGPRNLETHQPNLGHGGVVRGVVNAAVAGGAQWGQREAHQEDEMHRLRLP